MIRQVVKSVVLMIALLLVSCTNNTSQIVDQMIDEANKPENIQAVVNAPGSIVAQLELSRRENEVVYTITLVEGLNVSHFDEEQLADIGEAFGAGIKEEASLLTESERSALIELKATFVLIIIDRYGNRVELPIDVSL